MSAVGDLKFPFSIDPVDPLTNAQLLGDFIGMLSQLLESGDGCRVKKK